MSAPYALNIQGTDDETLEFTSQLTLTAPAVLSDYRIEYGLKRSGTLVLSYSTATTGVTVAGANVTIGGLESVGAASYTHGARLVHIASGKKIQWFDGTVEITDGSVE